MFAFNLK